LGMVGQPSPSASWSSLVCTLGSRIDTCANQPRSDI
jgi:hypothetical protein